MKTQNNFRFAVRKAVFTLAAAFAVAATQVTFAAEGPKPKVAAVQSTVFRLPNTLRFKAIVAPQEGKVTITIRSQDNTPIYSESLNNDKGYKRTFDFSTLKDGEYTFEISNGDNTQKTTFTIGTTMARVVSIN